MTIDEELTLLEENVRRLKVEYDIYFGGGARRAPTDLDWRVQGLIKKYSDSQKLTAQQRFKYNTVVQRYATYSDLWRQKLRIREEGYRRPQDALLGIQGLRPVETAPSPQRAGLADTPKQVAVLSFADSDELEGIRELYQAIQSGAGEGKARGSLESFRGLPAGKTKEIQNTYGCSGVEYTVEVKNGRAQIKARPNV